MTELPKKRNVLMRSAGEVKKFRFLTKLIPSILAALAVVIGLTYTVSVMYTKFGSVTISVNKYHSLQYGLSLADNVYFDKATSRLDCRSEEEITNIDGSVLDSLDLGSQDGNDSGDNYLCYTFYCKNSGEEELDYEYSINIANMSLGIEKACRVRVITTRRGYDSVSTDYARAAGVDDDGSIIPEPNTTPFFSKYVIMTQKIEKFKPGEVVKYTIVVWLEGNDPECIDEIIGGQMKMDMKFSVISVAGVPLDQNL